MRYQHVLVTAASLVGFHIHLWATDWAPVATTALVWIFANLLLSWAFVLWLSKNGGNGSSIPGEVGVKDFQVRLNEPVRVDNRAVVGCIEIKREHSPLLLNLAILSFNVLTLLVGPLEVGTYMALVIMDVMVAGIIGFLAFFLPYDQVYVLISLESSAVTVVSRNQKVLDLLREMAKQTTAMMEEAQ